ncbi:MAG: porin family protein [Beijerinckiaceae bacterium]|nr:porin family protein [Beijerinckiaceae bacterium]
MAADLPSSHAADAPTPLPIVSWTGVSVGGQLAYGFGNDNATPRGVAPTRMEPRGLVGGAHIGYAYQADRNLVVGLEGSIDGSNVGSSTPTFLGSYTVKLPIQGSIRGRAGFTVDRALFYASGGVAFATFRDSFSMGDSVSASRAGLTVGGGVEYAVSDRWSVRGEYRFSNFGTFTNMLANAPNTVAHKDNQSRAEIGFSCKFTEPAPPGAAKYRGARYRTESPGRPLRADVSAMLRGMELHAEKRAR